MSGNEITFLGVSGGARVGPGLELPSNILITLDKTTFVVDCGIGVVTALIQRGVCLEDLTSIFISHAHSDHFLGLGGLLYSCWTSGLDHELTIYGPHELKQYWQHYYKAMSADAGRRVREQGLTPLPELINIHIIENNERLFIDGIEVSILRNMHPPCEYSYAIRFDSSRFSVVYSGDTAYYEPLIYFSNNADVLIHEVMLSNAIDEECLALPGGEELLRQMLRRHTTVEEAARIARIANVKMLAFCHYQPSDKSKYPAQLWIDAARREFRGQIIAPADGDSLLLE